jgi:hypothetical protein
MGSNGTTKNTWILSSTTVADPFPLKPNAHSAAGTSLVDLLSQERLDDAADSREK